MAQIVTITNPLTGQPAQVDQLDHTAQQIDDGIGFESTDYPGCYYRTVDGVVEWLNPPMFLGVEYRTTERHQGMPVYKKLVYFGVLSQDEKLVSVSVANIDKLLRIDAYDIGLEGSSDQTGIIPTVRPSFYINFGGWKTPNNVVLASNSNWSAVTNWEAYAILSYTKTTD